MYATFAFQNQSNALMYTSLYTFPRPCHKGTLNLMLQARTKAKGDMIQIHLNTQESFRGYSVAVDVVGTAYCSASFNMQY